MGKTVDKTLSDSKLTKRFCLFCQKELIRKKYERKSRPGPALEHDAHFLSRIFCGKSCKATYQHSQRLPKDPSLEIKSYYVPKLCRGCGKVKNRKGKYCLDCFKSPLNRFIIISEGFCEKGHKYSETGVKAVGNFLKCSKCYQKRRERQDEAHRKDPKRKARARIRNWKKSYGMSEKNWKDLYDGQSGLCAVCSKSLSDYEGKGQLERNQDNLPVVDHCHVTHLIRGILCTNCNKYIIPMFERGNGSAIITAALAYLATPPAFSILGKVEVPESNETRKRKK